MEFIREHWDYTVYNKFIDYLHDIANEELKERTQKIIPDAPNMLGIPLRPLDCNDDDIFLLMSRAYHSYIMSKYRISSESMSHNELNYRNTAMNLDCIYVAKAVL